MQILIAIGMMIVSYFITASMMPKPQDATATALEDFDFPQVDEGTPQAVIFGDVWMEDWQVLWFGNYRTVPIYSEGGKK